MVTYDNNENILSKVINVIWLQMAIFVKNYKYDKCLANLNCDKRLPIALFVIFDSYDKIKPKVKIDIHYKLIILVTYDNYGNN